MSEKEVQNKIRTKADVTGANQAAEALDKVTESAKGAGESMSSLDGSSGLSELPKDAGNAAKSLAQLENEVSKLQADLRQLPVGSKAFVDMGAKIQTATRDLVRAETEAKKLGGTMGRSGNAGMAVLEFSRAFEDAQYGIRGVLNNIPGLITMLGGSAGLAGVISVVAVIGAQLWEKMSNGPAEAKKSLSDYLDEFKKAVNSFEDIEKTNSANRADADTARVRALKDAMAGVDTKMQIGIEQSQVEKLRIDTEARVKISQKAVELAQLEVSALVDGQTDALKLAEQRKKIAEDILKIERDAAAAKREQDLNVAQQKVDGATEKARGAQSDYSAKSGESTDLQDAARILRQQAEQLSIARDNEMAILQKRRESLEQALRVVEAIKDPQVKAQAELGADKTRLELSGIIEQLSKISQPTYQENSLNAEATAKESGVAKLNPELEKAATAQSESAKAMADAARALENLKQTQSIEVSGQTRVDASNRQKEQLNDLDKNSQGAASSLQDLLKSLGEKGGTDLAPFIEKIRSMVDDKKVSADDLGQISVLMNQYFGQIANIGTNQKKAWEDAVAKLTKLEGDFKILQDSKVKEPRAGANGTITPDTGGTLPLGISPSAGPKLPAGVSQVGAGALPAGMAQAGNDGTVQALQQLQQTMAANPSPDLAPMMEQLNQILSDKQVSAEELAKLPAILQQQGTVFSTVVKSAIEAAMGTLDVVKGLSSEMDQVKRDVAGMKINLRQAR